MQKTRLELQTYLADLEHLYIFLEKKNHDVGSAISCLKTAEEDLREATIKEGRLSHDTYDLGLRTLKDRVESLEELHTFLEEKGRPVTRAAQVLKDAREDLQQLEVEIREGDQQERDEQNVPLDGHSHDSNIAEKRAKLQLDLENIEYLYTFLEKETGSGSAAARVLGNARKKLQLLETEAAQVEQSDSDEAARLERLKLRVGRLEELFIFTEKENRSTATVAKVLQDAWIELQRLQVKLGEGKQSAGADCYSLAEKQVALERRVGRLEALFTFLEKNGRPIASAATALQDARKELRQLRLQIGQGLELDGADFAERPRSFSIIEKQAALQNKLEHNEALYIFLEKNDIPTASVIQRLKNTREELQRVEEVALKDKESQHDGNSIAKRQAALEARTESLEALEILLKKNNRSVVTVAQLIGDTQKELWQLATETREAQQREFNNDTNGSNDVEYDRASTDTATAEMRAAIGGIIDSDIGDMDDIDDMDNMDITHDTDDTATMDMTTAVGGIIAVDTDDTATMDLTTAVGGITAVDTDDTVTMGMTTAVGGIIAVDTDDTATMDLTTAVGGIIAVDTDDTATMDMTTAVGGIIAVDTDDTATMDLTTAVGGIIAVDMDNTATMDLTTAVGGIIANNKSPDNSRKQNSLIYVNPTNDSDAKFSDDDDSGVDSRYSDSHDSRIYQDDTPPSSPPEVRRFPGLVTPEQLKKDAVRGQSGVVVGYEDRAGIAWVIVRYGTEYAPKFVESTRLQEDICFDKKITPRYGRLHRLGDKEDIIPVPRSEEDSDSGALELKAKPRVTPYNFEGILGVEFKGPLKRLRPKRVIVNGEGKEEIEVRKFPRTKVLTLWFLRDSEGKEKSPKDGRPGIFNPIWETRSSLRSVFNTKSERDEDIYYAATKHNRLYKQWLKQEGAGRAAGKESKGHWPRQDEDVDDNEDNEDNEDESEDESEDNGDDESEDGDGDEDDDDDDNEDGEEDENTQLESMQKFKEQWCITNKVDLQNMSPKNQQSYLHAWDMKAV